mmetsp:Transcript_26518/g.26769  ORF Transcript_26518/g.26769 Transcript_26518/m.26769 type:complete len:387 (+) Transcript_26518:242-1402(+)
MFLKGNSISKFICTITFCFIISRERYFISFAVKGESNTKSYPEEPYYFQLGDLLHDWNPDYTSLDYWKKSKAHPSNGKGLIRLNYANQNDYNYALKLRAQELPFLLYNVPDVDKTSQMWTDEYLAEQFGDQRVKVEKSENNHFMYYTMKRGMDKAVTVSWKPPQTETRMTYKQYSKLALARETPTQLRIERERERKGDMAGNTPLYYMTLNAKQGGETGWIRESLSIFDPVPSFFIVDPSGHKGINCRFGMRGVVAANHYDGKRNFVAMIRGHKRYILAPPSECLSLSLLPKGHPSARHSSFDWSNMTEVDSRPKFYISKATEVVLTPGDILYIPSFWFHSIMSLDNSIQCNARSGTATVAAHIISECMGGRVQGQRTKKKIKQWQ